MTQRYTIPTEVKQNVYKDDNVLKGAFGKHKTAGNRLQIIELMLEKTLSNYFKVV